MKRQKRKLLTNEWQESHENAKICYICKENFADKYMKDKEYRKIRGHCHCTGGYIGAAHIICNSKYSIPKEITVDFHNGSNYDYHFIKGLEEEFEGQSNCLRKY